MKRPLLSISILIIAISIGAMNCKKTDSNPIQAQAKVTILGLDGATWEIIDILINQGELPGFTQLKKQGAWGNLETIQPTESIAIWTSIATGMSPSKHNVQTFTRRIRGTDQIIPSPGTDRKSPALWDMISLANMKVACVKWFATWPAEEVNGIMLSPRLEHDSGGFQTYPPEIFEEITAFREKSTMDDLPKPPKRHPVKNAKPAMNGPGMLIGQSQVQAKMFDDTSVWQAGYHIFKKYHPDVFMIYLKSIDRVEHYLWGAQNYLTKKDATEDERAEAEAIFGWYRYFDSIILTLLEEENHVLFVLSDHGMQARSSVAEPYDIRNLRFDDLMEKIGYLTSLDQKNTTDWSNTTAYTYRELPFDWSVEFNLNLAGREPEGVVEATAYEQMLLSVGGDLQAIKTTDGQVLFDRVIKKPGSCDLRCILNNTVQLDDEIVIKGQTIQLKSILYVKGLPRGIHPDAPPGIFAAIGPGIRQNFHVEKTHVYDFTPTALYALGLPIAKDFEGTVQFNIFDPEFRDTHPPVFIDTYGDRNAGELLKTTDADQRMKEELRALGYI